MLTITKPVQYGYRSVHDLPTPPSASRPSPPLVFQDSTQHPHSSFQRAGSPTNRPMSAPHRGLPPPAAMTLGQAPTVLGIPQPPGPGPVQAPPPPPPVQSHAFGQFPVAPSWLQEESMRSWLNAKAEEEKRRQEEEKTRQESYRLEQRRTEHEILRTSLQGGIPPPMVPVVFAGMAGGVLPQAALEWAQQYIYTQTQHGQPAGLLPPAAPSGQSSPEHHRRDSQAQPYAQYPGSAGVPSTPGSAQGPPSSYLPGYPGSPTRPRGQSISGPPVGRPAGASTGGLPNLNTNIPDAARGTTSMVTHPGLTLGHQPETQSSPSIYFHHWQPPASSGGRGSSDQPATPSVGESPRKRKATGPQPAAPPPSAPQRPRSPPFAHSGLSNPPPGRRRGHSRQRSDLGSYRPSGRTRLDSFGHQRGGSPAHGSGSASSSFQSDTPSQYRQHQRHLSPIHAQSSIALQQSPPQPPSGRGAHSVSSLLSDDPQSPQATQFAAAPSDIRSLHGEGEQRRASEDMSRGGAGSAATRERDTE